MRILAWIGLAALSVGCASQGTQKRDPLPFHVAVVPVEAAKVELIEIDEDDRAEVTLAVDGARLSEVLTEALDGKTFTRATLMRRPDSTGDTGGTDAARGDSINWVAQARELGADLILDTVLEYDEDVGTEINDRFWLNLPLFLLGGPATWFVNDRSYQFQAQVRANVYDVAAATRQGDVLDADSRVAVVDREVTEVSLDFLDRADGAGSYALSILVPSGFLAKNSDNVTEELELAIGDRLGASLSDTLQDRSREMLESDKLVAFHPENLEVVEEDGQRYLVGKVVLDLGEVSNLSGCRYRLAGGEWVEAGWSNETIDPEAKERQYELRVPIGATVGGTIQVEIQQEDAQARARSYTPTSGRRTSP